MFLFEKFNELGAFSTPKVPTAGELTGFGSSSTKSTVRGELALAPHALAKNDQTAIEEGDF